MVIGSLTWVHSDHHDNGVYRIQHDLSHRSPHADDDNLHRRGDYQSGFWYFSIPGLYLPALLVGILGFHGTRSADANSLESIFPAVNNHETSRSDFRDS